jgi:hypothetical protein
MALADDTGLLRAYLEKLNYKPVSESEIVVFVG